MPDYKRELLLANVNTLVGCLFILSFAAGAGLLVWHAAFGNNPLAEALVPVMKM